MVPHCCRRLKKLYNIHKPSVQPRSIKLQSDIQDLMVLNFDRLEQRIKTVSDMNVALIKQHQEMEYELGRLKSVEKEKHSVTRSRNYHKNKYEKLFKEFKTCQLELAEISDKLPWIPEESKTSDLNKFAFEEKVSKE